MVTGERMQTPQRPVALVTGGARGIGFGIARSLAQANYDLALCGRRDAAEVGAELAGLRTPCGEVFYCQADISQAASRARLLEQIRERFGRLNVLVNNAGVAPLERRDLLEATEESFERVLRINLQGPYFLTQSAATWMAQQKKAVPAFSGCIINISSISAVVASVNRGEYCVAKAGLSMMTRLFAVRLAEYGIPVYEIRPGLIETDMTTPVKAKYENLIAGGLLLEPRWGQPEDVARAVVSLCRGGLPYATGQVLTLDGGLTVQRL